MSAVTDAEGNPAKDAEMESFINGIKSQYEESLKVVLGRTDVDLMDKDPETGLRAVRKAETNLGDLCADASRYMMGADIGFMNGGGIRAGIEAGDITYEDALSVFPYGNMICMAEVSGQKIKGRPGDGREELSRGKRRLYPRFRAYVYGGLLCALQRGAG